MAASILQRIQWMTGHRSDADKAWLPERNVTTATHLSTDSLTSTIRSKRAVELALSNRTSFFSGKRADPGFVRQSSAFGSSYRTRAVGCHRRQYARAAPSPEAAQLRGTKMGAPATNSHLFAMLVTNSPEG